MEGDGVDVDSEKRGMDSPRILHLAFRDWLSKQMTSDVVACGCAGCAGSGAVHSPHSKYQTTALTIQKTPLLGHVHFGWDFSEATELI